MAQRESWSIQSLLDETELAYLKRLTNPESARVDIVAVHGLHIPANVKPWKDPQSFAARTWVAGPPGQEKLWLKDFLPADIPDARVFLFGYNSNVGLDTSSAGTGGAADNLLTRLRDARRGTPERPLVFLCHSLGGIVVKQAVARARSSPKYHELFHAVRAVAFFATPHRGGFGAQAGRAAAGGLRRFTGNVRSSIMEALLPDSFYSSDIHDAFLDSIGQIRICSFYEDKPMPGPRRLVVAKNSALLGLPWPAENKMIVPESNHSSICKFASRTQNYETVIGAISELIDDWALKTPGQASADSLSLRSDSSTGLSGDKPPPYFADGSPELGAPQFEGLSLEEPGQTADFKIARKPLSTGRSAPKGPFYVLPSITRHGFVGRRLLLDYVEELLESTNSSQQASIALYGLGGVGKTSVALQIIDWYRSEYPQRSIFWLQTGSADLMRQSLTEIGQQCGIIGKGLVGHPLDLVRQYLQEAKNGHWLLIVDNADSLDALGPADQPDTGQRNALSLRMMLAYYIPKCSHGRRIYTTRSKVIAEKLTNEGYVIEVAPLDHKDSHELLRNKMRRASQTFKSATMDQKDTLNDEALETLCGHLNHIPLAISQAAAFMRQQNVTIDQYLRLIDQDSSRLTHVLENDFVSMSSDSQWSKTVASVWNLTFSQIESAVPEAAELLSFMAFLGFQNIPKSILQALIPDEFTLTATALGTLQSYSLVNTGSEPDTFNMHLLVQLATRRRLESAGTADTWIGRTLCILSEQFPQGGYDIWRTCETLLPHALQALKHYSSRSEDASSSKATAELQAKIAAYYTQQWLFQQAYECSEMALQSPYAETKAARAFVLDVKDNQVWIIKAFGRLEEAELLAKEVWLGRQNLLGAKHVDTLNSLKTLSLAYHQGGKYQEAIKAARSALKSLQKVQTEEDADTFDMERRLGVSLFHSGEFEEAEKWTRQAVEGSGRKYGPEDLLTLRCNWHLARVRHAQGHYAEAERLDRATLTAQMRALGPDNHEQYRTLFSLANDLRRLGQVDQATALAAKVHQAALRVVGPDNSYTWEAAAMLASCLVAAAELADMGAAADQGAPAGADQLAEAAALLSRTLAARETHLRPGHPDTLVTETALAAVRRLRGDAAGAETLARAAFKRLDATLGAKHPWTLDGREGLARALWAQREGSKGKEKGREALEHARKVLERREQRLGWRHPDTRRVAELVIEMLADGKDKERLGKRLAEEGTPASS